jgi:hypothetical protein
MSNSNQLSLSSCTSPAISKFKLVIGAYICSCNHPTITIINLTQASQKAFTTSSKISSHHKPSQVHGLNITSLTN